MKTTPLKCYRKQFGHIFEKLCSTPDFESVMMSDMAGRIIGVNNVVMRAIEERFYDIIRHINCWPL